MPRVEDALGSRAHDLAGASGTGRPSIFIEMPRMTILPISSVYCLARPANRIVFAFDDFARSHAGHEFLPVAGNHRGLVDDARAIGKISVGHCHAAEAGTIGPRAVKAQVVVETDIPDRKRLFHDVDSVRVLSKYLIDTSVIAGSELVEFDVLYLPVRRHGAGEGQRTHCGHYRLGRDPRRDDVIGGDREMMAIVMPRRAAAAGLLGQQIIVIEAGRIDPEKLGREPGDARRQDEPADERIIQPAHLDAQETIRSTLVGIDSELILEASEHLDSQPADGAPRNYAGKLDMAVGPEKIALRSSQRVGCGQGDVELVVIGDFGIFQFRIQHGIDRADIDLISGADLVVTQGDVPVPPGLIVLFPALIDIGFRGIGAGQVCATRLCFRRHHGPLGLNLTRYGRTVGTASTRLRTLPSKAMRQPDRRTSTRFPGVRRPGPGAIAGAPSYSNTEGGFRDP